MRQNKMKISELKIYRPSDTPLVFRLFANKVACGVPTGTGDPTEEMFDVLENFNLYRDSTIIVQAQGDSMAPDIRPGDYLFIGTTDQPKNGDTVLAFLDDEALVKIFRYDPDTRRVRLVPLNNKFDTIEISARSKRLRIQGVVKFTMRNMQREQLKVVERKGKSKAKKTTEEATPLPSREGVLPPERALEGASSPLLDKRMEGRKGKKAALAIYCAAKQGLITETDYSSVADRFGDIGARQGYNYYMRNPQRFTQLEIESTTNFIQSLINPKGEQSDDAE